ncbi:DUF5682 family protein, partial [Streptomyces sp. 8N706]|uniref:DUF5682 family protein n=1 Tax=Streptomyces sp. 8N706 TaxID=3457416 RepID=UPI003FD532C5
MSGRPLLLGVRHHGPGSARAVREALDRKQPRAVLIEGPPEADGLVALAADEGMRPPVALLAHVADDPARAAFWPLAEFSPEWVAIRWALAHDVPVRFIDLPAAHTLAMSGDDEPDRSDRHGRSPAADGPDDGCPDQGCPDQGGRPADDPVPPGDRTERDGGVESEQDGDGGDDGPRLRIDPLAVLAEAAGYDDPERWWEDVVEHRTPGRAGRGAVPPTAAPHSASAAVPTTVGRGGTGDSQVPVDASGTGRAGVGATGSGAAGGGGASGRPGGSSTVDTGSGTEVRHAPDDAFDTARTGTEEGRRGVDGGARTADGDGGPSVDGGTGGARGPDRSGEGVGALGAFEALGEAMGALREAYGDGDHDRDPLREAHMRLRMREARREFGEDGFAVVCGAWHVPALTRRTTVSADRQLLKGLPKAKVDIVWVPWTHRRLSRHSGYGAGITSPGWYGHLFNAPDRPIERWMTRVAGLLRDEDHPVSSAHVIEAVRLADTLAAMRGRPLAGLVETTDAIRAVMCEGSDVPLALVQDRLIVGDVLGRVPESAPAVPLQRDLTRVQRTLRLKPEAAERELELDLRKDTDAGRSRLLHRLRLLGIEWGEPQRSRGGLGTFRETWRLRWEPELSVRVAEAGVWGTTVIAAATAKAGSDATSAGSLADVTALAERCLLAGLPEALPVVMRMLADRAALDADVGHLAQALPALVRSVRYGDVRGTDSAALAEVAVGLAERVFVGLPPACAGLDADAADEMRQHMDSVHTAVG